MVLSELLDAAIHPPALASSPGLGESPVRTIDVLGRLDRPVLCLTHDSRELEPGGVFVALPGRRHDGHDWIPRLRDAAAVIVERDVPVPPGVTRIRVASTRVALPWFAAAFYGYPAYQVPMLALTGTNGKTTTTYLVEAALRGSGWGCGVIGTTGLRLGARPWSPTAVGTDAHVHTTPEAPGLQGVLARMIGEGCRAVVMEASSIGIEAHRVDAIPFRIAGFSNFTRDHLDIHGTMQAYLAAKQRLFHELLIPGGLAVLNLDDPTSQAMRPPVDRNIDICTYGIDQGDLHVERLELRPDSSRALLQTPQGSCPLVVPLPGRHNVSNALCAMAFALGLGLPLQESALGLAQAECVPGRLQPLREAQEFAVLVDYAHTPDALEHLLLSAREFVKGKLILVFGCGGDRDSGKRPLMGRLAGELADLALVTSDNPRSEDPLHIIQEIRAGMAGSRATVEVLPDRREAIFRAILSARAGDVVLLAGKGHETSQEIAGQMLPFDDSEVAREALRARSGERQP